LYFDLLEKSNSDYKKKHALSHILTDKIRKFEWHDMDFASEINDKKALQQISQVNFIKILLILFEGLIYQLI